MVAALKPAMWRARARVSSSSLSGGTTRLTSPAAFACSAPMGSPVSSISMACLGGTARERGTIGVEQNSPISTPGVWNAASLEATTRSLEAAS